MGKRVLVIGAGASGLVSAITAARRGADVTVMEHKQTAGRKILMTGNGKCNLTNLNSFEGKYYSSDEKSLEFTHELLDAHGAKETMDFFEGIGLFCVKKNDGGVYPASGQAASVLEALLLECSHLGIELITDCEVRSVLRPEKNGDGIGVEYVRFIRRLDEDEHKLKDKTNHKIKDKETYAESAASKVNKSLCNNKKKLVKNVIIGEKKGFGSFDSVIIATGGKAAPSSGSDGSGYRLARELGHSIIMPLPALVQLKCDTYRVQDDVYDFDIFSMLSGVRAQAEIRLFTDEICCAEQSGELQLTDYGVSGIPVFQLSRIAARNIYENKKCELSVNFMTQVSFDVNTALSRYGHMSLENLLSGIVNKKLAQTVCRMLGVSGLPVSRLAQTVPIRAFDLLKNFRLTVLQANSFDNAQTCSGGIPLTEINGKMESKILENLYFTGEILDCDGICGGYNLQWAWATGFIAGENAAEQK